MSEHNNPQFPATVYIYRSRSGNTYWAFVYTDHKERIQVCGRAASRTLIVEAFPNAYHSDTEFSDAFFNHATQDWGYAGCTCEQLQAYVQKGLQ